VDVDHQDGGDTPDDDSEYLRAVLGALDAASPEPTHSPLLYELSSDSLVLHADRALHLGPPFSNWTPAVSWRVGREIPRVSEPTTRDHLLLGASNALFVDVASARVIRILGAQPAAGALLARWVNDAKRGRHSPPAEVCCLAGSDAVVAADLAPMRGAFEILARPAGGPVTLVLAIGAGAEQLSALITALEGQPGIAVLTDHAHPAARVLLSADPNGAQAFVRPARPELDGGAPWGELREEAETPLQILVLGAVQVRGGEGSLGRRPKLTELVAYFAMHPGGSASRAWTGALWPDRRVPQQTIANRLSEARRLLGFAPDHLPRLRRDGERHLLADVRTDWGRFLRLSAPDAPPQSWRAALELVRGRPFEDLQEGQWTVFEGFVAEMEQRIAATALLLGEHLLETGDADGAAWAAQQALRAAPYDERLHRLLMLAADRAGNRAGIEGVLQHLALMLEIDGDPLGAVHPETAALYQQLSGRGGALLS